ncbi:MAG: group II truncated hemoglobin [Anaerolineae bacterium]|jgi:hemoglobin|nr:group II truncated hemoglobin [Anaerolineae bacterium]
MGQQSIPTLYEWMGGDTETFKALIENFYDRAVKDPLLEPLFNHMPLEHRHRVAVWFAEVFGGPKVYSAEHGGHAHMVEKHLNLAITEKQQGRWVQLMQEAADAISLPKDPEFRSAFVAYVEWGTRMALMYSQPGMQPPSVSSPMPQWGWGEMKPYIPEENA